MIDTATQPTEEVPRPECREDSPDDSQAERPGRPRAQECFRATARHIATQLDIEAAMWKLLEKEPER